ncbi:MAG: DUF362 domain-containing protein [Deltaproteobacteria bacterium]|nr:MAG: DUF362 domain-containing protein [Deltaproteobacteria bacterium]
MTTRTSTPSNRSLLRAGERGGISRRALLAGGAGAVGLAGVAFALRRKLRARLSAWTRLPSFAATPPLVPHDPQRDRRTLYVAAGAGPAANIDAVVDKLGGIGAIVGKDDVVLIKVSAQWWNQGMTNVAAVRRMIEHVLERPDFAGEIVVFENTHFRLPDGSGLSRAWTRPSERNVDVPGMTRLGDLIDYFRGKPVGFVGLVDAGLSALSGDHWHDPDHAHGVYGGDGRGPIAPGEIRDGYVWDFDAAFRVKRSWVDWAQTPLTYPVFTSPVSGLIVDFRRGALRRTDGGVESAGRKLTWINMTTANEHEATGFTGACKSTMGVVDMSAGRLGTDPRVQDYLSVHHFGSPNAKWRMAGPLAQFAREVRAPDLIVTVAEWVAATPPGPRGAAWDGEREDIRLAADSAFRTRTVVAGTDPVAIDTWCVRNLLMPIAGARKAIYDLDDDQSRVVKFLRYYRQVYGSGTLDPALIDVV